MRTNGQKNGKPAESNTVSAAHDGSTPAPQRPDRAIGPAAEQRLVMRCLAGEELAWEQLYAQCHPQLLVAIRLLLGTESKDGYLVEEIGARVWYALLRNRARLLARYDPDRDSSLMAFFTGLARIEMMRHRRAERRRKWHEFTGDSRMLRAKGSSASEITAMINEFASTLTRGEKQFMDGYLTSRQHEAKGGNGLALSEANIWQRRHRIRSKLRAFLADRP